MSYKRFDPDDLAFFKSLCGEERVTERDRIGEDYCHDELGGAFARPDVRVQVLSTGEISAVMRYAYEREIPVTVRGSGTGLVGGAVPLEGGILLDTSGMTGILELDEKNMMLTVEPGVLLMDVAKYVEERGFCFLPDYRPWDNPIGGSDNGSFALVGVPIVWYHTDGHPDYHRPSDSADKIDYPKLLDIIRAAYLCAWRMANEKDF